MGSRAARVRNCDSDGYRARSSCGALLCGARSHAPSQFMKVGNARMPSRHGERPRSEQQDRYVEMWLDSDELMPSAMARGATLRPGNIPSSWPCSVHESVSASSRTAEDSSGTSLDLPADRSRHIQDFAPSVIPDSIAHADRCRDAGAAEIVGYTRPYKGRRRSYYRLSPVS